jgi:glycosyltransferase involved in cell wall biosynthesis
MVGSVKICLLIPSLQAGGMERVMSELATYFCGEEKTEIHLVMYGIRPELFYPVPSRLIIHQPLKEFNNKRRFIHTIKRSLYLRRTVRNIQPDTILSFGELWNSFILLSLWGLRFPVFISDRCNPARPYKVHNRLLRRLLYPQAKGVIAQTARAAELYSGQFRHNNIKVIGNPIRNIVTDNRIVRQNIVLSVGRLITTKHHDKLIEAFAAINKPGWILIIVGDNSLKQNNFDRLSNLVEELGLSGRVILAGKQPDIDNYYLNSSIFAFASSSEGFPNVIGEAMSAGLPVIAFDCIAGPSEIIQDNHNGYLIPLFDWEQFRRKLSQLMDNEQLRTSMGNNGRKTIKQFSIDTIGKKYLDFITSHS